MYAATRCSRADEAWDRPGPSGPSADPTPEHEYKGVWSHPHARVRETNRRFETLTSEMHQRFDRVHQELAENGERMAKLEGSLEGFLAGRRDRDAA